MKFKPGDKVVFVRESQSNYMYPEMVLGNVYTISECPSKLAKELYKKGENRTVNLIENIHCFYHEDDFELSYVDVFNNKLEELE